jgi:hypothetical protein
MKDMWLSREDFVGRLNHNLWFQTIQPKIQEFTPHLSLDSIDEQLSNFDDQGLVVLKTDSEKFEEFAVRKFNGVWKFSSCSQDIENVKYCRGAKSEYSRGKS